MPPCDSIILNQVNLELANTEILMLALEQLTKNKVTMYGTTISFTYEGQSYRIVNKKLICPQGYESTADRIKQIYSKECIIRAAKKFNWNIKTTNNSNKFQLQRKF